MLTKPVAALTTASVPMPSSLSCMGVENEIIRPRVCLKLMSMLAASFFQSISAQRQFNFANSFISFDYI